MRNYIIVLFTKLYQNDKIYKDGMWRHLARGEMRNAYKILVGMPERKRPLRRPRRRWKYNIKINLREIRL
jgi:hypothetical protein